VKEIMALNKQKQRVASLEDYVTESTPAETIKENFQNAVGQDSLTRFDKPKQKKKRPNNNNNKNNNKNRKPSQSNDKNANKK
jgi:hypothetical protein